MTEAGHLQRQEDHNVEAGLGFIESVCLKKKKKVPNSRIEASVINKCKINFK